MSHLPFLPLLAAALYDATKTAAEFVDLYDRVASGKQSIAQSALDLTEEAALVALRVGLDLATLEMIKLEVFAARITTDAERFVAEHMDHPDAPPQTLPGGGTSG